jgi:hypothetical protein
VHRRVEDAHENPDQRQVEDEQHHVADVEGGDQPPDDVGPLDEKERPGLDVERGEREEQDGGRARARNAEGAEAINAAAATPNTLVPYLILFPPR